MEQGNWILNLLGVIGIGSILTGIIAAVAGRKLTQANTGAKIIESADVQIENLQSDNDRLRKRMQENDQRLDESLGREDVANEKIRGWWSRADRHAAWDRRQQARNLERGIKDPMPPLYPPRARVSSDSNLPDREDQQ